MRINLHRFSMTKDLSCSGYHNLFDLNMQEIVYKFGPIDSIIRHILCIDWSYLVSCSLMVFESTYIIHCCLNNRSYCIQYKTIGFLVSCIIYSWQCSSNKLCKCFDKKYSQNCIVNNYLHLYRSFDNWKY